MIIDIQALWVIHTRTGSTCMGLENNTCVYLAVEVDNTTDVHGLIDIQVCNYSLECSDCYTYKSGTCMCNVIYLSGTTIKIYYYKSTMHRGCF